MVNISKGLVPENVRSNTYHKSVLTAMGVFSGKYARILGVSGLALYLSACASQPFDSLKGERMTLEEFDAARGLPRSSLSTESLYNSQITTSQGVATIIHSDESQDGDITKGTNKKLPLNITKNGGNGKFSINDNLDIIGNLEIGTNSSIQVLASYIDDLLKKDSSGAIKLGTNMTMVMLGYNEITKDNGLLRLGGSFLSKRGQKFYLTSGDKSYEREVTIPQVTLGGSYEVDFAGLEEELGVFLQKLHDLGIPKRTLASLRKLKTSFVTSHSQGKDLGKLGDDITDNANVFDWTEVEGVIAGGNYQKFDIEAEFELIKKIFEMTVRFGGDRKYTEGRIGNKEKTEYGSVGGITFKYRPSDSDLFQAAYDIDSVSKTTSGKWEHDYGNDISLYVRGKQQKFYDETRDDSIEGAGGINFNAIYLLSWLRGYDLFMPKKPTKEILEARGIADARIYAFSEFHKRGIMGINDEEMYGLANNPRLRLTSAGTYEEISAVYKEFTGEDFPTNIPATPMKIENRIEEERTSKVPDLFNKPRKNRTLQPHERGIDPRFAPETVFVAEGQTARVHKVFVDKTKLGGGDVVMENGKVTVTLNTGANLAAGAIVNSNFPQHNSQFTIVDNGANDTLKITDFESLTIGTYNIIVTQDPGPLTTIIQLVVTEGSKELRQLILKAINVTLADAQAVINGTKTFDEVQNPANTAPTASDFTWSGTGNASGQILKTEINSNISDAEQADGSLTPSIVSFDAAAFESVTVDGSGNLDYVTKLGYTGSGTIVYKVNDGTVDSSNATITVNNLDRLVASLSSSDLSSLDTQSNTETISLGFSESVTITNLQFVGLDNTTDQGGSYTPPAGPATNHNVTVSTPAASPVKVKVTYKGADNISVTTVISDIKVLIAANTAPTAADVTRDAGFGEVVTYDLAPDIADAESADNLLTINVISAPTKGSLSWSGTEFTYTATPTSGVSGTDTFTYEVEDPSGAKSATRTVTINNISEDGF